MIRYIKNKWHNYFHKDKHMKTLTYVRITPSIKHYGEFYVEYGLECDCGVEELCTIKMTGKNVTHVNKKFRDTYWRDTK